ncbi:MAG: efflux RND transporter periplasmic adaptor subunit, partial [Saprospiraceae bacterium]|nr:efflux RND transporter periplasmic adaptor subunit [Saprospiraceae bacterium]
GEYLPGRYVRKNTVLGLLEHPDYLKLQQDYREARAQLEFLSREVDRKKELSEANAGALRDYQEATSRLESLQARIGGLQGRLKYLGIDPDKAAEGQLVPTVAISAPISGFITEVNINVGKFVRPGDMLYEIVDNEHIHLELDIFEKDIAKVEERQRITFSIPSLGSQTYEGYVQLIGRSFDKENKTVRIHGHIEGQHPRFIRGLYVEAKIWTDDQTVRALPQGAVVKVDGIDYIFVRLSEKEEPEWRFRMIPVKTGPSDGDYVAVTPLDSLPDFPRIVTDGAYYLSAEMIKGELEHSH